MKKLSRKETAKINGGIRPDQCFYRDPATNSMKVGCRRFPIDDGNGGLTYPLEPCGPCFEL